MTLKCWPRKARLILAEPNEIILTRSAVELFFPTVNDNYELVLGSALRVDHHADPFTVVGVCEDVPTHSHLQFDVLVSYASFIRYQGEDADNSWTWSDFYHYVQLAPDTDVKALERKFVDFSDRYFRGTEVSGSEEVFTLQPLGEAHLYSHDLEYEIGQTTNGKAVWSLLIIAFFILVIAWINYINLSSVRAIERSKEVGIRKAVGATRGQLIRQFLGESLLINLISLGLAIFLVQFFTPWFAINFDIAPAALSFYHGNRLSLGLFLSLLVLIGAGVLVSGFYPAWLLSAPHVSEVLKGVFAKDLGGAWMRKGLVIFQFTTSIVLIIATWMVSKQISFMTKRDLGIQVDEIITINGPTLTAFDSTFIERINAFKDVLEEDPNILHAATSNRVPGNAMGRIFQIQKLGEGASQQTFTSNFINADYDFADTYGLMPVVGRYFRVSDHNADFAALENIAITQAAVDMLGYPSEAAAIGQQLRFWGKDWRIVGVLPDYHQQSLHHRIEPILYLPMYSPQNYLSAHIRGNQMNHTLAHIKSTYEQFFPGNNFQYEFLDQYFQRLYESDQRFSRILYFFTLLTIFIACLGLFGLASYMTILRTKEIGIRKVLGASIMGLVTLLSKDFMQLVVWALVLAIPLAYMVMNRWLQGFAYAMPLPWWVFVLAGLLALGIAFLTVGFLGIRAAMVNPVKSLRDE